MRNHPHQKQGMAIRWRFDDMFSTDQGVATGPVVNDHRVFHGVGEFGGKRAGHKIGRAAGRKWHDDADWLASDRKLLRVRQGNGAAGERSNQDTGNK